MKKYGFWCFIILLCLFTGYDVVMTWEGRVLSEKGFSKEALLQAARVDPKNAEPFFKLALLHQWSLLQLDLDASEHYFQQAVERNPLDQGYWIHLAKIFQRRGNVEVFEHALDNAIRVFPTGYQGRWVAGNLLLQQGAVEKAIPHFSYILAHYPNQSSAVYDIWEKVAVDDPEFLMEKLIPQDPACLRRYLADQYGSGDKELVKRVWRKAISLGVKPAPDETLRHIEFLISKGELQEAFSLWKGGVWDEHQVGPQDGDIITNGGFERQSRVGHGLDLWIGKVKGAVVSFYP